MSRRRPNPIHDPINQLFARLFENLAEQIEFATAQVDNIRDAAVIPPVMLKKLISLCHPDKHGNSEVSQEVTRWLLEQRRDATR